MRACAFGNMFPDSKEPELLAGVCVAYTWRVSLLQKQQARHATRNAQAIARANLHRQRRTATSSDNAGEAVLPAFDVGVGPSHCEGRGSGGSLPWYVLMLSLQAWIRWSTRASWEGCSQTGWDTVGQQSHPVGPVEALCLRMLML